MPLDTYANLQTAVLAALARPDDPLVAPAVPDMIKLFESEAKRRLKTGGSEYPVSISTIAGNPRIELPADCGAVRTVAIDNRPLLFLAPQSSTPLLDTSGCPRYYTLFGSSARAIAPAMRLVPAPDRVYTVVLNYLRDLPPLSDIAPTNWLLSYAPDAYFFGTLVEAEMYVGHDERVTMWLQRRDLAFAGIEKADIKARWAGPLQLVVDGITSGGGWRSGSGSAGDGGAPAPVPVPSVAVYVVSPASGALVTIPSSYRAALIDIAAPLAHLTIRLPEVSDGEVVEVAFTAPVTTLALHTDTGGIIADTPGSAYGPGAALVMRYVADAGGWQFWG